MSKVKDNWVKHSPVQCETIKKFPSNTFNNTQLSTDKYSITSKSNVCISCYSLYIQVCKEVADKFNLHIDYEKQEWTIEDLYYAIKDLTEESTKDGIIKPSNISNNLKDVEEKLQAVAKCLRARIYHHKNCTKRNPEYKIENKPVRLGNLFGDVKHDSFIIQLCYEINRLYDLYKTLIVVYNYVLKKKTDPYHDKLIVEFQDILNHCDRKFLTIEVNDSNILNKKYLVEERDKYINDKTINYKKTKKSRTKSKSKYKPKKQIRDIVESN